MSLPKQVINLLGIVVVLAIVAIGGVAVAAPLYMQAMSTDTDTAGVAQTNSMYEIQVQGLQAAKKNLPQTQSAVAALHRQMPVAADLDDVFEIVNRAAKTTTASVATVSAGEVVPFAARTTVAADGTVAPAPAPTPAPSATPGAGGTAPADAATSGTPAAPAAPPAADPRMQAPFTITVDVSSPEAATAFLDELRKGPRLIAIVHSALSGSTGTSAAPGTSGSTDTAQPTYQLTVDALAFVRAAE
ncbi:hypothetical protein GCM10022240_28980 [Microbacterium kribbense]|uniref:Tfp pilus assembly protein PilO n=1 Tax=Microbacterium kribbense TaxID=433645 RepID=A0ABP7GYN1_9MICO